MNYLHQELKGKVVSVIKNHFGKEYQKDIAKGFVCEGGFGCSPNTNGESIYGRWVATNEHGKISGRDVEKLLDEKTPSPENV